MEEKLKMIPKTFNLFATEIKVVFDNQKMNDMNCYGLSDYSTSTITLANTDGTQKLSEGKLMDTFYHEKVHIILNTMNENELSKNEKFVDVFAKLLRQSDVTSKY